MNFILQPWQFLSLILAASLNQQQRQAIEYLRTENQVLKENLGKKRIVLSDDQRRRLAGNGKLLGRKALREVATIAAPDTILRWHRLLVAKKWDYSHRRKNPGRPPIKEEVVKLVLKMVKENPTWGYDRIQGALANLGHKISDQSVGNILKQHGIEPAPDRKRQTTWKTFLNTHWEVMKANDFTTVQVWTKGGLMTFYLLFVMDIAKRRVCFAGCTTNPNAHWMKQIARQLTDSFDGFLCGKRYLLMDGDSKFCFSFKELLRLEGITSVLLPPMSPNLNAHLERFHRSLKAECLDRLIFFGEHSLRKATNEFLKHYHHERITRELEIKSSILTTIFQSLERLNVRSALAECSITTIETPRSCNRREVPSQQKCFIARNVNLVGRNTVNRQTLTSRFSTTWLRFSFLTARDTVVNRRSMSVGGESRRNRPRNAQADLSS